MPEKKDIHQLESPGGVQAPGYELASQKSIDLLLRLLEEFQRRSKGGTGVPPEVEKDIAIVAATFESVDSALALRESPITVSGVAPSTGPAAGGTRVTIAGSHFLPGSTVRFGSSAATDVSIVSLKEIAATTPPGAAGAVDVVVETLGGSTRAARGFTYHRS